MKVQSVPVGSIKVRGRTRKDMGDVAALAASIEDIGLLQPIVVDAEMRLVAGERRLRAVKQLKWDTVPVSIAKDLREAGQLLLAERDENTCRKAFTPEEAVAMGGRIESLIGPPKEEARLANLKQGTLKPRSANLALRDKGRTRDVVASHVGMGRTTYEKAKAVVASGDADAIAEMNETGKVDRAFRKVKKKQELKQRAAKAAAAPVAKIDQPCDWAVINGDCIQHLKEIRGARLVFADPPYNIGIDYGQGKAADNLPEDEFLDWTEQWIEAAINALTPDGSLWILINDEWADHVSVMVRSMGMHRRAWIKWYETFGVNCKANFNRTSRHVLYFVKDPKRFVFDESAVLVQSARAAKYNDARASSDGNKIMDDVWQIPRVTGTSNERMPDFPTQVPEELLRRVVGCATKPGDLVVDPFNGSGTTGVIAKRLGRKYIGIEKEEKFWEAAKLRIAAEGY